MPKDDPIVKAEITIPEHGNPVVTWQPPSANPEELGLMALCYGVKIGWLMEVEVQVRDLFTTLALELASLKNKHLDSESIIESLPTARELHASLAGESAAVPNGEVFEIQLFRKSLAEPGGSQRELAWVNNSLPQPGLASNIPWSVFLLADKIWPRLNQSLRKRLVKSWDTMLQLLSHDDGSIEPGDQGHLQVLYMLISAEWFSVTA